MPQLKHELLIQLLSNPLLKEELLQLSACTGVSIDDVLNFRNALQFNEREILIRPFIHTRKYISNEELEIISSIYFSKYGLYRKKYTEKVKTYALIVFKYLYQTRKPFWLQDIAKYELILFSQLWITSSNHENVLNSQYIQGQYSVSNLCRLGKFSFDIEAYMENSETSEILFEQKNGKYLVFIGDAEIPSVSIKSVDKLTYSLIKFCTQPRSLLEISDYLKAKLSLKEEEIMNISHNLVGLLESWNILTLTTANVI